MTIDEAKQLDYAYTRREHTAAIIIKNEATPIQFAGAETGSTATKGENIGGEVSADEKAPIIEREWVSQFNGA